MNALSIIILTIIGLSSAELLASVCKKPSGEYEVANHQNCSSFIKCVGFNATELSCPDGKRFDANLKICRPQSVAVCAANDIPNYIHQLCKDLHEDVLVPAIECDMYYKCNGAQTTAYSCPNGEHFSRAFATCMSPARAGCKSISDMCLGTYAGFKFGAISCEDYFECSDKLEPKLLRCNDALYFSANQQNCTEPALSGCSNEGGGGNDNGSCDDVGVPKCDSSNSGAFFPHPKPDWFYMCYRSNALELQCESGLTYDTVLKYCVKEGANRVCSE